MTSSSGPILETSVVNDMETNGFGCHSRNKFILPQDRHNSLKIGKVPLWGVGAPVIKAIAGIDLVSAGSNPVSAPPHCFFYLSL